MSKKILTILKSLVLASAFAVSSPVFAAKNTTVTYDSLVNKALYSGIQQCYNGGAVKSSFNNFPTEYTGAGSLINSGNSTKVALPTGFYSSDTISCSNLFNGVGGVPKIINAPAANATTDSLKTFMNGMGYTTTINSGDRRFL